ncbi:MAG: polymerase subunit delta [Actinomycetota bacterium]|jgi:DNA polymerase-3 subunit delta|nr:polymerase subunit delta [Actinomycetota bacterium]
MSKPAYLLKGSEFLADEALQKIRAESRTDPLSEVAFDPDAGGDEIVTALNTTSLLGGQRLVLVRGAHELKKDQAAPLLDYLEAPSPDSLLVLIAAGRTKFDDVVKRVGAVVTLEAPKGRRLVAWTRERARTYSLKLDDPAAWALVDAVGVELRDLDGALSQLSTALGVGSRVGREQIRAAFPRLADERMYVFTDAVGDRRLGVAMVALRRLLEQGDPPLVLFGALVAHVRRMLRARLVADQGAAAVGALLGLPEWRAQRLSKQTRSYREEELISAMGILAATDLELKGGESPEAALERAVVQIIGAG